MGEIACAGISPVVGDFQAQIASNAENVSIWCIIILGIKITGSIIFIQLYGV